ncbi:unnamed protein product, partial [Closterium sp. NIES-54]
GVPAALPRRLRGASPGPARRRPCSRRRPCPRRRPYPRCRPCARRRPCLVATPAAAAVAVPAAVAAATVAALLRLMSLQPPCLTSPSPAPPVAAHLVCHCRGALPNRPALPSRAATVAAVARPLLLPCTAATAATLATAPTATMASPTVLTFDAEGRAVDFDMWVDNLHFFLQCDSRDGVSLFEHTSGVSTTPAATADSIVHSQWTTRDAVARLAVRSDLPPAERAHFGQYKTA